MLSSWRLILPLNFSWGFPSPWSSQLLFSMATYRLFFLSSPFAPSRALCKLQRILLLCCPPEMLPRIPASLLYICDHSTYCITPFPPPLQIFFVLPLFSFCLTAPEVLPLWYLTWPSLQPFLHSISSHLPALCLFSSLSCYVCKYSVPSNGRQRTSQQTEVTLPWFYKPFRLLISWLHFQ